MDGVSFVRSVELAEPKMKLLGAAGPLDVPQDDKAQGFVCLGSVVAFTEDLTGQSKADILNAFLLAQLAADRKFKREKQTQQWYDFYKDVLGKIGFVIQAFQFTEYRASGAGFKMDAVVLDIIEAAATGNELKVLKATFSALRSLEGDDKRLAIFDSHSSSNEAGNFQCSPCTLAKNGDVAITVGAFHFKSTEHKGSFLFFHWSSSSIKMYKGTQSAVLNVEVYSQVRDTIVKKLGNNAKSFVQDLDIGDI